MILAKVVGTIVTTISHPHYKSRRLLLVQPLALEGGTPDDEFVAIDSTQAGIGDTVLVNREGSGARQVLKNPDAAVISVIVGIVDSVFIEEFNANTTKDTNNTNINGIEEVITNEKNDLDSSNINQ